MSEGSALEVINVPFRELMDTLADVDRVPCVFGFFVGLENVPGNPVRVRGSSHACGRAAATGRADNFRHGQAILKEKLRLEREEAEVRLNVRVVDCGLGHGTALN